jgi:hypothetical protein
MIEFFRPTPISVMGSLKRYDDHDNQERIQSGGIEVFRSMGKMMWRKVFQPRSAPSIAAASYSDFGISGKPTNKMIT